MVGEISLDEFTPGKKARGKERHPNEGGYDDTMTFFKDTRNAKCPLSLGNFTPKTSNYCLKNRALGFPGMYFSTVCGIPFFCGVSHHLWCIFLYHFPLWA